MILDGKEKYKQEIINLWRASFPKDCEDFIQFYFEKKYNNKQTLLYVENEKICSCLQMLPYSMKYYEYAVNTAYISGAMTSPESRNQGLMSRLLYYAFIKMKRGNIALTTLIPQETWLIDYYKKFGYVSCFDQELKTVKSDNYPCFSDEMLFKEYQHSDLEDAYLFYSKHLENQSICIQKTLCDFSVMAEECQRFEGNVYLLVYQEEIVGIGFCFLTDDKIILKDFIAKDENFRQYFLAKLLQEWNKPIVISHSTQGMARILNAQMFLQLFAKSHPHLDFSVKVHDNHIDENNFTFFISKGTVIFRLTHTADFDLSIGGLTHLLLGRTDLLDGKYNLFPQQQPFMSLMLD